MATQSQKAAATSVGNQYPQNPFSGIGKRLGNLWGGITNAANTVATGFNAARTNLQQGTNPENKQAQLAQQATPKPPTSALNSAGIPIDVAAPPVGTPGVKTPAQVAGANPANAKTLGDANSTDAQKAALQSQITNLQNQITTDTNAGYSGNQQINTDANGNVIPNTGGTNAQSNYIQQQAQTQNPDLRQQVINSQAAIAPNAQNNLQTAQENLKNFQTGYAQSVGKIEGEPIGLDFQQGQKQVIANQYASSLPAYTQAVNTAQTALGQGVTANQNVISATQPQLSQYGETYYKPPTSALGGTQGGGQQVSTTDPFYATMQTYANLLANNQGASIPSSITGNSVLNAQLLTMAKQINPNFNPNVAAGVGSAQSSTAATQTAQVQAWQSSLQQGQNLQAQFTDLLNTFGLNPSDINAANAGIQKIASNVSDPKYKMLSNYVADIANTYAQILTPAGSNVSDYKTQIANSMLDQTAKGSSLQEVMKGLDSQAQAKIAGVSTTNSFNQNTNGNSNSANPWH